MKVDCVLTAVNTNPLYIEFVPYFIKVWRKIMPTANIKIILIADSIPDDLVEYQKYFILFSPIKNVSTSFTSQYIRLLYPALLTGYKDGIMITDIDMIPLNKKYYIDITDEVDIIYKNRSLLYSTKSQFQKIEVYNHNFFGNILVIDDDLQLTENDERTYHEMIVHVPMNYLENAKLLK